MVGEISSDMMFWMRSNKMARRMGVYGHSSVRMGAVGLVGMGERKIAQKHVDMMIFDNTSY